MAMKIKVHVRGERTWGQFPEFNLPEQKNAATRPAKACSKAEKRSAESGEGAGDEHRGCGSCDGDCV